MSSHYRDTSVQQLVEKERQARLALARAEKANHELEQALLEKSSEANSLINHYVQEVETKAEIILQLKKQVEFFRCSSERSWEGQLQEIKKEHLKTQQNLRKEIEDLSGVRADNEMKDELIQSLRDQFGEMKVKHFEELQAMEECMELKRKQIDDRLHQMETEFEQFTSENKLVSLLRKLVVDNQSLAQQLNSALALIEALSAEREIDNEVLQQCRREVELYMQSNNLNIKLNWALKRANHSLKKIIHNMEVSHSEEID